MFKAFRQLLSNDLAIDLGTANVLIYSKGKGIVLNEPAVVAVRTDGRTKSVAAVGSEAKSMLGRAPDNLQVIRPMRDGVIADFTSTEIMLKSLIHKAHSNSILRPSPRVLVCVPCGSTQVERRAIQESVLAAGASDVLIVEEPMAAAIGAGLPVSDAKGSMVADIGGGTTELAIISLNGLVYSASVRIGGDRFDDAIIQYVRRQFGLHIGETTAEQIKLTVGYAFKPEQTETMEIRGRHVAKGVPRTIEISSDDTIEALREPLTGMVDAIRTALENCPPELSSDIYDSGITLTGGGALLKGLDKMISAQTGIPVKIAENPLDCVAIGGGLALDIIDSNSDDLLSERVH